MAEDPKHIELKFTGAPVEEQQGAPADAVINALQSLQRILHLIGMKEEGRVFGQRVKPSARVRREYLIICKSPEKGSHVQPIDIPSRIEAAGGFLARDRLLSILKAFDSGDSDIVSATIPDPRERWFFADAAAGLVPDQKSGLELTIRPGSRGPFSFKADRARVLIESMRSGKPPTSKSQRILCRLRGVTFDRNIAWLQPSEGPSFRVNYPSTIETMLQSNPRKRLYISGMPTINAAGDLSGFSEIESISEFEPTAKLVEDFQIRNLAYELIRPIRIAATFSFDDNFFCYQNEALGLDVFSETYEGLLDELYREIDLVWRNYAEAPDEDLADDAIEVKQNLRDRFRVVSDAER